MPSAARKLDPDRGHGPLRPSTDLHAEIGREDATIGPAATRRPTAVLDPRLVHGGVAQGVRLLRRLQRTPGNAAVARTLSARNRPATRPTASKPGSGSGPTILPLAGPSAGSGGGGLTVQAVVVDVPPPPRKAPVLPPYDDPRFARATEKAGSVARREKKHTSARSKAAEAQGAAVPPANDASSQAATAQVGKMDAQKPGEFDKKAFIAAVEKAVDAATPGSLKQATEFKESGKAGEIKGKVAGMVSQDKQRVEKGIKDKTKEPPDTSVAVIKSVTPLKEERAGALPTTVGAAAAMPPPRPAGETDLRHGPAAVENEMAEADVTEAQLREANEPEFAQALEAKKTAEVHSAQAPAVYRAQEADTLGATKAAARGDEKAQLTGMHRGRISGLRKITGSKSAAKLQDEARRREVATKIEGIFAKTKAEVTKILDGIEAKMTPIFDRGEKSARATFEAHVSARMKAYKKKRYSGLRGKARWLRDKFRSLPSSVNKFYEEGKTIYLGLMTVVIGRVADLVAGELKKAKTRIKQGRDEVKTYVDSLPKNLKKVGKTAQSKMTAQFDSLESDVDSKQDELVNALAEKYTAARKELDERIVALQEENKGLIDKAIDFAKAVINTIRKLKDLLFEVLARAMSAIGKIIRHPIRFLGNLVGAVKSGIMLFKENIEEHLYAGLTKWLFGQLAKTGLELPKPLDAKGILGLLLQILGLTWANIRARAVDKLGASVVARMEEGVEVFKTLKDEGVGGLWKFVADKVGDLKNAIIAPMIDFVKNKIIVAGVMWLVSLLTPASAFIKAAKAIYDIVMFFVERAAQLKEFVDAVLDSIEAIASGGAGAVGKLIEKTLAKMVPLVVGFLAALLNVGGIGEKVRSVIEAIQKPVKAAVDFVLNGAMKLGRKLFGGAAKLYTKGKAWVKGKADAVKDWATNKTAAAKDWVKEKLRRADSDSDEADVVVVPFKMHSASHRLIADAGPSGGLLMASGGSPLSGHVGHGLQQVKAQLEALEAARIEAQELAAGGSRTKRLSTLIDFIAEAEAAMGRGSREQELEAIDQKGEHIASLLRKRKNRPSKKAISAEVQELANMLESYGRRHNLADLGPMAPNLEKTTGAIAPYTKLSSGRSREFGVLEAEHIVPGSIISALVKSVNGRPVYRKLPDASTSQYHQDTTLLLIKLIADIKTDEGARGLLSDQERIRDVKQRVDRVAAAVKAGSDVDAADIVHLNAIFAERAEITKRARDLVIYRLQRGTVPMPADVLVSRDDLIADMRTACSDGMIDEVLARQLAGVWDLAKAAQERSRVTTPHGTKAQVDAAFRKWKGLDRA